MTVAANRTGRLPALMGHRRTGSDVMKRIAALMVGGPATSFLLGEKANSHAPTASASWREGLQAISRPRHKLSYLTGEQCQFPGGISMRKLGYGLLVTTGLLIGTLAEAQGASQPPSAGRQADDSTRQQPGCACGMTGSGMMAHGMGGAGMNCPMRGMADVQVEQTQEGATLHLTAKNPSQVEDVQRMAEGMQRCMSGSGAPQQGQPASPRHQQR